MTRAARTYHHGNLRQALLDAAADLVAETGVESITMRALGERLGVSRAAPYRHFEDKGALLVAVAAAGYRQLNERLLAIESPPGTLEHFRRMGEEYVRFALENPAHYGLMYGREALGREDVPELRAAADSMYEHVADVIRALQRGGRIRRQDPHAQAYVAWSAMHGLASLLIDGQIHPGGDVDALIRQATRAVLDGLRPRR